MSKIKDYKPGDLISSLYNECGVVLQAGTTEFLNAKDFYVVLMHGDNTIITMNQCWMKFEQRPKCAERK